MTRLIPVLLTIVLAAVAAGHLVGQSTTPDDLDAKRKVWQSLPEKEKARLREKYRHYQSLPDAEKQALELRLGVLRELMDGEQDELPPDDRPRYEQLDWRSRQRFLLQRVRHILEQGPKILEDALGIPGDNLDSSTLLDRAAEANSRLFSRALDHFVRIGNLSEAEREKVTRRFRRSTPFERLSLIREYVVRHPSAFGFEDSETQRLRRAALPDFVNALHRRLFRMLPVPDSFRLTPEQQREARALPPRERDQKERGFIRSNVIRTLRRAGVTDPLLKRLDEMPPGRMLLKAKRMLEQAKGRRPGRGPSHAPAGRMGPRSDKRRPSTGRGGVQRKKDFQP